MAFCKNLAVIILLLAISVVQTSYGRPVFPDLASKSRIYIEEPGADYLPPGADVPHWGGDKPPGTEHKPPKPEEIPPYAEYEPPPEVNEAEGDYPEGKWVEVKHGNNPPELMFMPHGADFAGPEAGYQPPKPKPKPTKPQRKPPRRPRPKKKPKVEPPRPTRPAEIEAAEFKAALDKVEKDFFAAIGNKTAIVFSCLGVFVFLTIFIFGLVAFIQNRNDKKDIRALEERLAYLQAKHARYAKWKEARLKQAGSEQTGLEQVIVEPTGLEQAGSEQTDLKKVIVEPTGLEQAGSEKADLEKVIVKPTGLEQAGSEQADLEKVIVEPTGLEQAGSEQTDLKKVIVE